MLSILLIDNYDSFTYNLFHLLREIDGSNKISVVKNDQIIPEEVLKYDKILLSPGPGLPKEAGKLLSLIQYAAPTKDILGICLGLQAIAEVFGCTLKNLPKVYHGVATQIHIQQEDSLFQQVPNLFEAGRYHSWAVDKQKPMPAELEIIAEDAKGEVMALRHKYYAVKGLQFHPESILTPFGRQIMTNWLQQK